LEPARDDSDLLTAPMVWRPRPKFQDRVWLHVLLFLLTVASTTFVGANYYAAFLSGFSGATPSISTTSLLLHGFWYSGTVLAILGCHEMGHYLACRYYDVDASRPFFLPLPLLSPFGTLGAFIRIREPIPQKRILFDIGIAGPIAGFLIAVPTIFMGIAMSNVIRLPNPLPPNTLVYGEPLIYKIASHLLWGTLPAGHDLNLHPMGFGAWFGLFATALNLFPVGQLDGGHISYAVLGRRSSHVTLGTIAVGLVLSIFAGSWIVWSVMMLVMLRLFGRHHPPVFDEETPLDRGRLILAVFALVMFILCFIPVPLDLIR
jgi:membrane-associated protease RseP (regulator of RpoE activity)